MANDEVVKMDGSVRRDDEEVDWKKSARLVRTGKHCKSRLYSRWLDMRNRCFNSKNNRYHRYGGRGIKICDDWNDFAVFRDWALKNGFQKHLTIERLDNDEGYSPENCAWVSIAENLKNKTVNSAHGMQMPHSRLTDNDVIAIRAMRRLQGDKVNKVAGQYDVSVATIYNIRARRSWKHI